MQVKVNVRNTDGKELGEAPALPVYSTDVYDKVGHDADDIVAKIITENAGAAAASGNGGASDTRNQPARARPL